MARGARADRGDDDGLLRLPLPRRIREACGGRSFCFRPVVVHAARRASPRRCWERHRRVRRMGELALRSRADGPARGCAEEGAGRGGRVMGTSLAKPNGTAIGFFFVFIIATLVITGWAARRTKTTSEFFAAGSKVTGF